jgi:predicted dehydrogenase
MKKLRWGVIGAGGIAHRRTLPVIGQTRNCVLSIVMDVCDPDKFGAKYGVDFTDSIEAVLSRDDVDAVYIASPVHLHAEQAVAAAKTGKHVLCEKPLARTLAEARPMVEACRDAGVLLREAYMLRYHGAHREIARLIGNGAIGKPLFANVHWAFLYPKMEGAWRQIPELGGGGALADVGCHVFDLLRMFVGEIRRLAAVAGTLVQDYQVDDLTTVLLEFESGAQGSVTTSFAIPDGAMPPFVGIYGSTGSIEAVGTLTQGTGGEATLFADADGQRRQIQYEQVNTYVRQLEAFADDVARGAKVEPGSEPELLRAMAILDASYESARTAAFVAV